MWALRPPKSPIMLIFRINLPLKGKLIPKIPYFLKQNFNIMSTEAQNLEKFRIFDIIFWYKL